MLLISNILSIIIIENTRLLKVIIKITLCYKHNNAVKCNPNLPFFLEDL